MKPGVTRRPVASSVVWVFGCLGVWVPDTGMTSAILSPSMTTSPANAGFPVPSTIVPFLITIVFIFFCGARGAHALNHNYRKYKNLIKDFIATAPNRLWVADITYIDTDEGVMYLHLVTDAFTHEIIGWMLSDSLMAVNTIEALSKAIDKAHGYALSKLIHHSDRGSQYCCNDYVNLLKSYQVSISMTEDYKPTDNAIAERVNGIIKVEWLYRQARFKSKKEAQEKLEQIIDFYNTRRPHMSNNMLTPQQKRTIYEEKCLTGAVCPQRTASPECFSCI